MQMDHNGYLLMMKIFIGAFVFLFGIVIGSFFIFGSP